MALLNRTNVTASSIRLSAAAASVAVTATIDYDEKPLAAEAQAILNTLSAYKHPLTRASPGASVEAVDGAILTQALKELLSPPLSPSPQAPRMAMPAMPPSRPSQTGKEEASSSGTQDKSPLKKREIILIAVFSALVFLCLVGLVMYLLMDSFRIAFRRKSKSNSLIEVEIDHETRKSQVPPKPPEFDNTKLYQV